MKVLEIDNIELGFGKTTVLNAIYLKAEKGKITGLLGRNGSGKTSLLRIIFGELIPKNKLIKIDSKAYISPLFKKRIISYLPQFNIFPDQTTVKKAFQYFSVSLKQFLIHFPSFTKHQNSKFYELSGGERRVIETYIILKAPVKITLLDEPFSHIAPLYIEKLKELIKLEKQNKIIIITDHLYNDTIAVTDDLYLLKDGWIKLVKSPEDLLFHNYINSI